MSLKFKSDPMCYGTGQLTSWMTTAGGHGSRHGSTSPAVAVRSLASRMLKSLELDADPADIPQTTFARLDIQLTKSDVVKLQRHLLAEEGTQAEVLRILAGSIQGGSKQTTSSSWFSSLRY